MSAIEWAVSVEVVGPANAEPLHNDVAARFARALPRVAGTGADHRFGATFAVNAASPSQAVDLGVLLWKSAVADVDLPDWPIVRVEVMTLAEQDVWLSTPGRPVLVGISEIAAMLDVSEPAAHDVVARSGFPEPLAELAAGPIWAKPAIDNFIERRLSPA